MEENIQNPATGLKGVFPGNLTPNIQPTDNFTSPPENQAIKENNSEEFMQETNTYLRLETRNGDNQVSGVIEIDLISFREKGQESRYLSINTIGSNPEGHQSNTSISIENEEDFNKFKKFISNINWND